MRTSVIRRLARLSVLAALVAALLAAFAADASAKSRDLQNTAIMQVAICEFFGGTATYDDVRTDGIVTYTEITCTGGLLGGVNCENYTFGTECFNLRVESGDDGDGSEVDPGQVVESVPVVEAAPVVDETPVVNDVPVVEAAPVVDVPPVVKDVPVVEAVPAVEAAPVVDETPVVKDVTAVEAAPVVEAAPDDGATAEAVPADEGLAPVEKDEV